MDCSLPGSSVHEIFQARVLEWVAIAFSDVYTYKYIILYICLYISNKYSVHHLGHTYPTRLFVVHLQSKLNWVSCIFPATLLM